MDFDLSWSVDTSDGLYWGIATSFRFIEHGDSNLYGLCWDVSIFGTMSRDLLICWHTLRMVLLSSCWLKYTTLYWGIAMIKSIFHWSITTLLDLLHWGISIFWRDIRLILYIGACNGWYSNHWIVSFCHHLHTRAEPPSRMFWHRDLTFYLWLLFSIDYGVLTP